MAMSDCPKCWETPCVCGHEYKSYSVKNKIELISAIVGISEKECVIDNAVLERLKLALKNKKESPNE